MVAKSREGKTFRHRQTNAIVLCVKSRVMSANTFRHTLLVLDRGDSAKRKEGEQTEADETPMMAWEQFWEGV